MLIFLLYPGNDITCLDRVSPTSTHIETTNARDILETDLPDSEHKLTLIFIPKGSYQIAGSDPPTEITYPYWLGKYEVTQEEWKKVMGWTPVPELNEEDTIAMGALYPMCQISYYECLDFCDRLTEMAQQQGILPKGYCFSLPTVAQWELACSCGKEIVSSGNLEKIAWTNPHGAKARVYPVGLKEPNAWGFHDMWEMYGNYVQIFIILIACMAAIQSTGKRIPEIYQPTWAYRLHPWEEDYFTPYWIIKKKYLVASITLIQENPIQD